MSEVEKVERELDQTEDNNVTEKTYGVETEASVSGVDPQPHDGKEIYSEPEEVTTATLSMDANNPVVDGNDHKVDESELVWESNAVTSPSDKQEAEEDTTEAKALGEQTWAGQIGSGEHANMMKTWGTGW